MRPDQAIADENEELGGALPRNYNSWEKPILRQLLKILNRIPRANITEDAFGEISQYFLGNFAQKEGHQGGDSFFYSYFTSPANCRCNRAELYSFRLDENDRVKVNNSTFPHGSLPIIPV
jgi:hypothetical protein